MKMSNENEFAVIQLFQGCLSKNIVISTNLSTNQNNTKNFIHKNIVKNIILRGFVNVF